jgi:beta-glucosidase
MRHWVTIFLLSLCSLPLFAQSDGQIKHLLNKLTVEEKAQLLVGSLDVNGYFGIPQPTGTDGIASVLVPGAAGQTNSVRRLGIPPTVLSDGTAGLRIDPHRKGESRSYYCTAFPVGVCLASTWNTNFLSTVGKAMGNEVREYGVDLILGPGVNIMRNPLCGRNFEYYSEDPLLAGKMAAALVRGIQSEGVGACVKHFAANNQETNRNHSDSQVDERTLREIYLKPFEIIVKEAHPWMLMAAYNKLNGEFCQTNRWLLTDVLRNEWGYDGVVVTDWSAPKNTSAQVHAGNDLMMPGRKEQVDQLVNDVREGRLSIEDLDRSVLRVLGYIVRTPRYRQVSFSNYPPLEAHAETTRQAAVEGCVLLENRKATLPIADTLRSVALFGVTGYDYRAGGSGSGYVHPPFVTTLNEAFQRAGYRVDSALADVYRRHADAEQAKFSFSKGAHMPLLESIGVKFHAPEMSVPPYLAEAMASRNDIAVITLGRSSSEGFDRELEGDFLLTPTERQLISNVCQAFHAVGKRVAVVLNVGGVVETASWSSQPDAILLCWQGGETGATAVVDLLSGRENPSGRLPVTFPKDYFDEPSAKNFPYNVKHPDDGMFGYSEVLHPTKRTQRERNIDYTRYEEGLMVGYRHFTSAHCPTAYPFGYGLSYTHFTTTGLRVHAGSDSIAIHVTVTNSGLRAGKQVVQLYVEAPQNQGRPLRELKAFAKTRVLTPGQKQKITLRVARRDLCRYYVGLHQWVLDAGTYRFEVGNDAENIICGQDIQLDRAVFQ